MCGKIRGSLECSVSGSLHQNAPNLQNLRVSDLILSESREWDVKTINSLLWPMDGETILHIPLSISRETDLMIWHYSNNGIFSVHSAYHHALSLAFPVGSSDRSA
ncbi:UNVERIFIED_CONTAM: hypothetical protein Sangu_1700500 [Sesamum angustifolium]|uniref:Uncharacterized protein n=1 Tax=Sesamum angustifolium TaxID=2727405 RepID=A0AAW2MJJ9_9LAMI